MNFDKESLKQHAAHRGKLEIHSKVPLSTKEELSTYYTPWVAAPCREIQKDPEKAYEYTWKSNSVAIISDGTAVLSLWNIGWLASLPVMEWKAVLMREFAWVNCVPIVLDTQDPAEIISTIKHLSPGFGMIVLEDIKAPQCFYIEEELRKLLPIPVFHDDQHGTAIVALAAVINALKLVDKKIDQIKIVMTGAWAAGLAIAKLLHNYGATNIILCDTRWAIYPERENLNEYKQAVSTFNKNNEQWSLSDVIAWADLYIGVSMPNVLTKEDVKKMNDKAIVFALANPDPEISHKDAMAWWAYIYGSGRSDIPNQINNLLAFPGVVRGALDTRIENVTKEYKIAAAEALAAYIQSPTVDRLLPNPLDKAVPRVVAQAMLMWDKTIIYNKPTRKNGLWKMLKRAISKLSH